MPAATQEEKRRQILAAAVRAFARKGYHACRVSEIAEEAGVAYGLVSHFGSKEESARSATSSGASAARCCRPTRRCSRPMRRRTRTRCRRDFRDPDDLWIGTNVHLLVILQNTKLLPADQGPKTWADLLDPKWKGKIAFTDPANSGSAYSNVTMLASCGAAATPAGTRSRSCSPTPRCSTARRWCSRASATANSRSACRSNMPAISGPPNGAPVKVIYPADGTVAQMEGVAIIKGGPNAENAKQFVDYVTRKDVREMILQLRVPPRRAAGSRPVQAAGRDAAAHRRQARRLRRGRLDGEARRDRCRRSRTSSAARADR